jgi:DnaJ-class molecular chaperone
MFRWLTFKFATSATTSSTPQLHVLRKLVCAYCWLTRLIKENAEVDLEIEPGMVQGQELKFHGEGEAHADGRLLIKR